MNRVSAPIAPPSQTTASRLTASKYCFNLARSWPPSASPNSLDHSLQVYLQTRTITASKFPLSQPPSVSLNSHDYSLQVRTIMASKCISKLTLAWLPSASLNSPDYTLEVYLQSCFIQGCNCISKLIRLWPLCASPYLVEHGLRVRL